MSHRQHIAVISGRSGAGKSTAARALEDLGYFVVDNLPLQLFDELLALSKKSSNKVRKLAIVADVREAEFLNLLPKKWLELDSSLYVKELIYLDASDKTLIDRYHETRRRHPLDDGCGINKALELESLALADIRAIATKEIFSDKLNTHELKNEIKLLMGVLLENKLKINFLSFGFKNGVPLDLDLCFDVRFLKNPHYDQALRPKTGLDKEVADYVLNLPSAKEFLDKTVNLLEFLVALYQEEGRSHLTVAIGCTGGKHRSVALAVELANRLKIKFDQTRVEHRDVDLHY